MFPNITGLISDVVKSLPKVLGKMVIIPLYKEVPVPIPAYDAVPFVIQFNPESYTENNQINYCDDVPFGNNSAELKFKKVSPREFSFKFLIDGTGASGQKMEVDAELLILKKLVAFSGGLHRPRSLLLLWGTYYAVVKATKFDISHTLFRNNGTVLRAEIDATFKETKPHVLQNLINGLLSPDLTTRRKVDAGDTLPLMCEKVYDDKRHYLEVARANNLTNFRKITPGVELYFPAVEKN